MPPLFCFHCGEPVPQGFEATLVIAHEVQPFCCYGCMAVAETIISGGLESFYRHRTELSEKPEALSATQTDELLLYDDPALQTEFVDNTPDHSSTYLNIYGITCAACIWLLERELTKLPGVDSLVINHTTHKARLQWHQQQVPLSQILLKIHALGYKARPYHVDAARQHAQTEQRTALIRVAVAGIASMQNMMFAWPLYLGLYSDLDADYLALFRWVSMLMCLPVVGYSAWPFMHAAYRSLKVRQLIMDVPVALGILVAFVASGYITLIAAPIESSDVYFDSVSMFTFLLLLGRYIEMQTRHKHLNSDAELGQLLPVTAIVKTADGEASKPAHMLQIGDLVVLRQGQLAPTDGIVVEGESRFDEAALTGEFLPVTKVPGSLISGGTANIENTLLIKVTALPKHCRVAAILKLLDQAQSEKPSTVILADRVASYFVAMVLLSTLLSAAYWLVQDSSRALAIALSVLVVTCPCALSLATPTALTAATTFLRRQGFLIAKGHALEAMNATTDIVFDKTGTLTEGNLRLDQTVTFHTISEQHALEIAAALEQHSSHPIAQVFTPYWQRPATLVSTQLGQGISGQYQGVEYYLGTLAFVDRGQPWHEQDQAMASEQGQTGLHIYLSDGTQVLARFSLSDTLRASSKVCVQQFQQRGIRVHILSGDQPNAVSQTAHQLGIEQFKAAQSPEQKLAYLRELQNQGRTVAMIGDGINDLPVLAGANLSIAMGRASDLAKLNSDAVLLNDRLEVLNQAFTTATRARKIIRQNIAWAIIYNAAMLPLAMVGWVPPYLAALGMSLSSLLVVFNSLRLNSSKKGSTHDQHPL